MTLPAPNLRVRKSCILYDLWYEQRVNPAVKDSDRPTGKIADEVDGKTAVSVGIPRKILATGTDFVRGHVP